MEYWDVLPPAGSLPRRGSKDGLLAAGRQRRRNRLLMDNAEFALRAPLANVLGMHMTWDEVLTVVMADATPLVRKGARGRSHLRRRARAVSRTGGQHPGAATSVLRALTRRRPATRRTPRPWVGTTPITSAGSRHRPPWASNPATRRRSSKRVSSCSMPDSQLFIRGMSRAELSPGPRPAVTSGGRRAPKLRHVAKTRKLEPQALEDLVKQTSLPAVGATSAHPDLFRGFRHRPTSRAA